MYSDQCYFLFLVSAQGISNVFSTSLLAICPTMVFREMKSKKNRIQATNRAILKLEGEGIAYSYLMDDLKIKCKESVIIQFITNIADEKNQ